MSYEFEPACRRMEWLDPFYRAVWEKAFADTIPISGTFELTPRCNFDCRMCYVHLKEDQIPKYGRELNAKEWLQIAREAKDAGTTWLCITGGEPLMHPEFETIWKELSQMGFFITLQTNASLIRGKMTKLLEQYPPRHVKITLYGSSDEVYEKVCQIQNGFTRVDEGIDFLQKLKIPLEIVGTIIKQNETDVYNMMGYVKEKRLGIHITKDIQKATRSDNQKIEEERCSEFYNTKQWERLLIYREQHYPVDIKELPCTFCKEHRIGYWITWDGDMRFCSLMDRPNNKVLSEGFSKAWKKLIDYEENLSWPVECLSCKANKICLKCPGILNAECGDPEQVGDSFCGKYINFIEKREKNELY